MESIAVHNAYINKHTSYTHTYILTFISHLLGIEPGEDEDGEDAVHDKINQDRGCVVYPYRSSEDEALFMVLDGHGEQGDRISEFVMRQVTSMPKLIVYLIKYS